MTRASVRLRLTALYSGLFLGAAAIVLGIVYLLLRRMLQDWVADLEATPPDALPTLPPASPGTTATPMTVERTDVRTAAGELSDAVLRFQWGTSLAAVVALTVLAALSGWWLSGRILRPLQRITPTARRLTLSNLDERINLHGPPDELKELADTFDAMVERLRASADSQRRFVANAAHELRTPLATPDHDARP